MGCDQMREACGCSDAVEGQPLSRPGLLSGESGRHSGGDSWSISRSQLDLQSVSVGVDYGVGFTSELYNFMGRCLDHYVWQRKPVRVEEEEEIH